MKTKLYVSILLVTLCSVFSSSKAQTYQYDQNGRLIADPSEQIASIEWNNQSKIVKLTRTSGSIKPDLEFGYDATGNRLVKIVKPRNVNGVEPQFKWEYTYYSNDISGTVAIAEKSYESLGGNEYRAKMQIVSNTVFSGGRIGMIEERRDFSSENFTASIGGTGTFTNVQPKGLLVSSMNNLLQINKRGLKQLELTDHLGNVIVVVHDRKSSSQTYEASLVQATDYYPYGMTMRKAQKESGNYRYGFEGIEKDDEIRVEDGSYEFPGRSIYDPRLAKFVSVDPQWRTMPNVSPYAFGFDNPLFFTDKSGETPMPYRIIMGLNQAATEGAPIAKAVNRFAEERLQMFKTKSFIDKNTSAKTQFIYGVIDGLIDAAEVIDPMSWKEMTQALYELANGLSTGDVSSDQVYEMLTEAAGEAKEYAAASFDENHPDYQYNGGRNLVAAVGTAGALLKLRKVLGARAIVGRAGCFVGDTEILTAGNKFVYIKDISVEKEIYKLSDEDIKMLEEERAALEYVVEVTLENIEFTVEEDQLFIVNDEWKKAIDLVVGDKLLKLDGTTVEVKTVRKIKKATILSAAGRPVGSDQKE